MTVLAANVSEGTVDLIEKVLQTDRYVRFSLQNNLDLSDRTIYLRLCMINFDKKLPENEDVKLCKAALYKPGEFENYWRTQLAEK